MTQRAEPSQITLSAMRDLFTQKFLALMRTFDQAKWQVSIEMSVASFIESDYAVNGREGGRTTV